MKRTFTIPLAATGLLLALGLSNCKKEQSAAPLNDATTGLSAQQSYSAISATSNDRIDEIVKDLAVNSYSLHFDQPDPASRITRTAYGTDNYIRYASAPGSNNLTSQKVPVRIPFAKIPQRVSPSCSDFVPMVMTKQVFGFLQKVEVLKDYGLQEIALTDGGAAFVSDLKAKALFNIKSDKVDDMLARLDSEKFSLLDDPSQPSGLFIRNFYGNADLNENLLTPYKKNFKDILRPKYIGCFDNEILKLIKEKFQAMNPSLSRNLGVTPIADARNAAILSFQN